MASDGRKSTLELAIASLAIVLSAAALITSIRSCSVSSTNGNQANSIAQSALKIADQTRYAEFTVSFTLFRGLGNDRFSDSVADPMDGRDPLWLNASETAGYWLSTTISNASASRSLVVRDFGFGVDPKSQKGFWAVTLGFTRPDYCSQGYADFRCLYFPVTIKAGESQKFQVPLGVYATQLVGSGRADPISIGINGYPRQVATQVFNTNVHIR